ncbi:MAG: hypothetical protein PHW45_04370 [Candidatus ainarchaeum sp.]|nr:hypothetical protein [Candidatus ainarchaeum sp.]MDD4221480.1 hypothetical protein [Candidatus ainarchaeum sp.]MDD4663010.1 hypothetical protein [Candidatus ainarchaeum sp.]
MKKILWWAIILIPILFLIYGYIYPSTFFSNQEIIRDYILSFGSFAPLAYILPQIVQVVITPINHYVIGILGGYIFGT